ncbi:MAG: hypothetical protein NVV63_17655 [Opitutus sp.]|nr:hypothetical protein [Opitutus sp.]
MRSRVNGSARLDTPGGLPFAKAMLETLTILAPGLLGGSVARALPTPAAWPNGS